MVKAPFTPEQVAAMNRYQQAGDMHPFTCGNNRSDAAHQAYQERHGGDLGQLVATVTGWMCPVCGYTQDWAHGFMAGQRVDELSASDGRKCVLLIETTTNTTGGDS